MGHNMATMLGDVGAHGQSAGRARILMIRPLGCKDTHGTALPCKEGSTCSLAAGFLSLFTLLGNSASGLVWQQRCSLLLHAKPACCPTDVFFGQIPVLPEWGVTLARQCLGQCSTSFFSPLRSSCSICCGLLNGRFFSPLVAMLCLHLALLNSCPMCTPPNQISTPTHPSKHTQPALVLTTPSFSLHLALPTPGTCAPSPSHTHNEFFS